MAPESGVQTSAGDFGRLRNGRVLATENFFINGLTVKQFVGRVFEWFSMRIIRITVSKITKKDYENWIQSL